MLNSFRVVFTGNQVIVDPVGCDYSADNVFYSFDWGMTGEYSHLGGTAGASGNYSHDSRTLNDIVRKYGISSTIYNAYNTSQANNAANSDTSAANAGFDCGRYSMQQSLLANPAYWTGDIRYGGNISDTLIAGLSNELDPTLFIAQRDDNNSAQYRTEGDKLRTINNGVFSQFWQEDFRCPMIWQDPDQPGAPLNFTSECMTGFCNDTHTGTCVDGSADCPDCSPSNDAGVLNESHIPCARCENNGPTNYFGMYGEDNYKIFNTDVRNVCIYNGSIQQDNSYPKGILDNSIAIVNGPVHPEMGLAKRQFELYSASCLSRDGFFGPTYRQSVEDSYYLPSWYAHKQWPLNPRYNERDLGYAALPHISSGRACDPSEIEIAHWEVFDEDGNLKTSEFKEIENSPFDLMNYIGSRPYEGLSPMNYALIGEKMWWWPESEATSPTTRARYGLGNRTTYFGRPHWFDTPDTSVKCGSDFFALDGGIIDGDVPVTSNALGFDGGRLVGPYRYWSDSLLICDAQEDGTCNYTKGEGIATRQHFLVLDPDEHWDQTLNDGAGGWNCDPDEDVCKTCFLNDYGNGSATVLLGEDEDGNWNQPATPPFDDNFNNPEAGDQFVVRTRNKFINAEGTKYFDYGSALAYEAEYGESCDDDQAGPHGLGCFTYPLKFIAGKSVTGLHYLRNTTYRNPDEDNSTPTGITGAYDQTITHRRVDGNPLYGTAFQSDAEAANWTYDPNAAEFYDDVGDRQEHETDFSRNYLANPRHYVDRVVCTGSMSKADVFHDMHPDVLAHDYWNQYAACTDPCSCYNQCKCYTWGSNPVTGISTDGCEQYIEPFDRSTRKMGWGEFTFSLRDYNQANRCSRLKNLMQSDPPATDELHYYGINCDSAAECAFAVDVDTRFRGFPDPTFWVVGANSDQYWNGLPTNFELAGPQESGGWLSWGPYAPLTKYAALHGAMYNGSIPGDVTITQCSSSSFPYNYLLTGDDELTGPFWEFHEEQFGENDAGDPFYVGASCPRCTNPVGELTDITQTFDGNVSVSSNFRKTDHLIINPNEEQYLPSKDRWPTNIYLGAIGAGGPGGACVINVPGCEDDTLFDFQRLCMNSTGLFNSCSRQGESGAEGSIVLNTCNRTPTSLIIKVEKMGKGGLELWKGRSGTDVDEHSVFPTIDDRHTKISVYEGTEDANAIEENLVISIEAQGGRAVQLNAENLDVSGCGSLLVDEDAEVANWKLDRPLPGRVDSFACAFCAPPPLRFLPPDSDDPDNPGQFMGCKCRAGFRICTLCDQLDAECTRCDECTSVGTCCRCGACGEFPLSNCGSQDACTCGGGGGGGGGGCNDPSNCGFDTIPCCIEQQNGTFRCEEVTPQRCADMGGRNRGDECISDYCSECSKDGSCDECLDGGGAPDDELCPVGFRCADGCCVQETCGCRDIGDQSSAPCSDEEPGQITCCYVNVDSNTVCETKTETECAAVEGVEVDSCADCIDPGPCGWCVENPVFLYDEIFSANNNSNPPEVIITEGPKWSEGYALKYNSDEQGSDNAFGVFEDEDLGITDVHTWHELAGNIDTELVRYDSIEGQYQVKYEVRVSDDGTLPTNLDGWYYNFTDENLVSRSPHSFTADPWSGKEDPNDISTSGWEPNDPTPEGFAQGIMWRLGKTYIFDQSPAGLDGEGNPINGGPIESPSSFEPGCGTRAIYFGATEGGVGKLADVDGEDTSIGLAGCSTIITDTSGAPIMLPAPWVEYVWVLRDPSTGDEREYWVSRTNGIKGGEINLTNGYQAFKKYQSNWNTYTGNPFGDNPDDFGETLTVVSRKVIFNVPETLDETSDPYSTRTVPAFINRLHRRAMIVDENGQVPDDGPTIDHIVRANRYARTSGPMSRSADNGFGLNKPDKFRLRGESIESNGWRDPEGEGSDAPYDLKDVEEFLRGTGTYSLVIKMGFANGPAPDNQGDCLTNPEPQNTCRDFCDLCGGEQGEIVDSEYPIIGPIRPSRSKRIIKPGIGGCGSLKLLQKDLESQGAHREGGGANGGGAFISWGQTVNDAIASL